MSLTRYYVCNRCQKPVEFTNVSPGYFAYCPYHDEDLYSFEVSVK